MPLQLASKLALFRQWRSAPASAADACRSQPVDRWAVRFRRRMGLLLSLCAVAASMPGCASTSDWLHNGLKVGPEYCRPAAPVADQWIDAYDQRLREELSDNPEWWLVFDDPAMTRLANEMYQQNLPLRVAGLRVLQARYQRAIAAGSLFPQQQDAFGNYERLQLSSKVGPGLQPGFPRTFSRWGTGFDMIWELDVWGKFRRNIEAADATLDASIEDYDAILVSLLAETTATYVEVRTVQQQLEYAHSNVKIQEGSLGIAETRFRGGATTELDVTQARTSLQNTRELIPLLTARLRIANNRLCVLTGSPPRDLAEELGEGSIPTPPSTVAVGIPANLIRRRPDVRKAEREVAAQSARIGVAAADLLPHFSIAGNLGYQASSLNNLFTEPAFRGVVSPGFNWSVLNYGRLLNNVRVQDARFQELAVQYQETVLLTGEETENAIVSFLQSQQRLIEVQGAVVASKRSVELAIIQYRDGATDFNRVFTLQDILVQQQDRLASVQGDLARSLIAIYKALGGGWQIRLTGGAPLMVSEPVQETPAEPAPQLQPAPGPPDDAVGLYDPDA